MMHRRRLFSGAALVAASLVTASLGACAWPTPSPVPNSAPQAVATLLPAQVPTALPKASPTVSEPAKAAPQAPPTLDVAQLAPLGTLGSFRRQIREVIAEQGRQGTRMAAEIRFVGEPQAVYSVRNCAGSDEASSTCSDYICKGGYEYIRAAGGSWTRRAVRATQPDPLLVLSTTDTAKLQVPAMGLLLVRPEATLLGATGRYVGVETINGVPSWHYHYDAAALGPSLLPGALPGSTMKAGEVDVWVSADTRVAVRLTLALELQAGSSVRKLEVQMDTFDVNAPLKIEVPTEFAG